MFILNEVEFVSALICCKPLSMDGFITKSKCGLKKNTEKWEYAKFSTIFSW